MRIPAFCICENKDADQIRGNRLVTDMVGNPEDRFSHNEALLIDWFTRELPKSLTLQENKKKNEIAVMDN